MTPVKTGEAARAGESGPAGRVALRDLDVRERALFLYASRLEEDIALYVEEELPDRQVEAALDEFRRRASRRAADEADDIKESRREIVEQEMKRIERDERGGAGARTAGRGTRSRAS